MDDILELQEKLEDLEPEDALSEVDRLLESEGNAENKELLFMEGRLLFFAAEKTGELQYYFMSVMILSEFLEDRDYSYSLPSILSMLTWSCTMLERFDRALIFAKQFYDTHTDDLKAHYYLAFIYSCSTDESELTEGLEHIDAFITDGEFLRGANVKINILTALKRFDEAEELIRYCESSDPEFETVWLEKRFFVCIGRGDDEQALRITDQLLDKELNENMRINVFYRKFSVLLRIRSKKEAIAFAVEFAEELDDKSEIYGAIAYELQSDDLDGCIKYYELANTSGYYDMELIEFYQKKGDGDSEKKLYALAEKKLADDDNLFFTAMNLIYGKFYRNEKGLGIKMLKRSILLNPDFGCAYTMLGKAHECGIGTDKDPARAFEYYKQAYDMEVRKEKETGERDHCGCGALFCSFCLYYGVGTEKDPETAKKILLHIMDEREESDRVELYAVYAFDGDKRFSKKKAVELLKMFEDEDAACAFLLYKYSDDKLEKIMYWDKFVSLLSESDELEKDYLTPYLNDPDLPFVPFIRN